VDAGVGKDTNDTAAIAKLEEKARSELNLEHVDLDAVHRRLRTRR
jgi:hypothetical protein